LAIVASLVCFATAPVAFAPPPWTDDDPRRAELAQRLDDDHLARRLDQAVARLDLTPLWQSYAGTGSLPCRPDLMLRAVLYEVQRGRHSPAAWHRDAAETEPVRWLLRGGTPSRSCWYAFRDRVAPFLDAFHRQTLQQAVAGGLTPATRGAEDGTLVAANASRHKMVHAATPDKRAAALAAAVAADEGGAAAPAAAGAAVEGGATTAAAWMAKTPVGRRTQQKRIKQAQKRMNELQTRNRGKRSSKRKAADKVVVSVSDPEAVAGRDKEKVYRPLYNVQVVDDLDSPFVLGYEVFARQNDAGLLATMLARLTEGLGHPLQTLLADTAYAGGADLAAAARAGATPYAPTPADGKKKEKQIPKSQFAWLGTEETYTCPQGHRLVYESSSRQKRSGTETVLLHSYRCPPTHCRDCPVRAACTPNPEAGRSISRGEHEALIEALRARMATAEAKALYRLRSQTVELVNADWKEHRKLRRFSGRGLTRVRCQVGLVVLAHNLVTLLSEEKKAKEKKARAADVKPPEVVT
jgi:transposase